MKQTLHVGQVTQATQLDLSIFIIFVLNDSRNRGNVLYLFGADVREIVHIITYFLILLLYFWSP